MGSDDFDRIIDSVYEAADDPAGFAPALSKIGAALGATANQTFVIAEATSALESHHYGADPASFLEYERHWRERDPRFAFAVARPNAVLSDVMVLDPAAFERSAVYNEHLLRADARYTLFGSFRAAPDVIVASAFMRPKRAGAFEGREVRTMNEVAPHLKRAARLRATVGALRSELLDLRRALDVVVVPMMVLDAKRMVICANQSAEDLLRARDGIVLEKGCLSASSLDERSALESALAKSTVAAQSRAAQPARARLAPSVSVTRRDGTRLSLAFLSLGARNDIRVRATPAARVLVLVHDPSTVIRLDRALIAELHGLTATEAELAATLAEGKTLAEFAAARGSSEQTARTHLKRILDKTETRRQADLVRILVTSIALHERP